MENQHGNSDVAIFWDYENCPAPASASGWETVREIRNVAQAYGSVKVFKAYLELPGQISSSESRSLYLRSELQASGVSLTDCPHNGRKDVADKMMLVDMMAHAIDNPTPLTYILITGDRDFAYAISVLRLRCYEIILVTPSSAHSSLTSQPTACLSWNDLLERIRSRAQESDQPPPTPKRQSRDHITVLNADGIARPYPSDSDNDEIDLANYLAPEPPQHNRSTTSRTTIPTSLGESPRDEVMTIHSDDTLTNGIVDGNSSALDDRFQLEYQPEVNEGAGAAGVHISPGVYAAAMSSTTRLSFGRFESDSRSDSSFSERSQVTPDSSGTASNKGTLSPSAPTFLPNDQNQHTSPQPSTTGTGSDKVPETPEISKAPEIPATPKVPKKAEIPATPKTSKKLEIPATPKTQKKAGIPATPKIPKKPEIPESPKIPKKPEIPESPKIPKEPEIPEVPKPSLPPAFQPLIRILRKYKELGFPRPPLSRIALALGAEVYKAAGVQRFGQYVAIAENDGMVTLGGREADAWIALRPEWF